MQGFHLPPGNEVATDVFCTHLPPKETSTLALSLGRSPNARG